MGRGNEPKVSSASPNIVYEPLLSEPHHATESEVYLETQLEASQVDNFDFRPEASEQVNHEAHDTFTEDKPEMRVALNSKRMKGQTSQTRLSTHHCSNPAVR